MPDNITFTDGNNDANLFIKELYIGSNWEHDNNDKMVLYQAIGGGSSPRYSITIGIHSSYSQGVMHDGFTVSNNDSSGPIKLEGIGIFEGVDCYVMVDWDFLSDIAMTQNRPDGSAWFDARVCMNVATDIENSPSIKRHFLERGLLNMTPQPLQRFCFARVTWTDVTTNTTKNVYNKEDLADAILNHSSVTINLMADIALSGTGISSYGSSGKKSLVQIDNKNVIINGNGHKLFDFAMPITGATLNNGRYYVQYAEEVTGKEAFTTQCGDMILLAKSNVYTALGWYVEDESQGKFGLYLPTPLANLYQQDFSDLFVSYRLSYMRFTYRVTSISANIILFTATDLYTKKSSYRDLSPQTDFFLVNYNADNDGIIIQNRKLSFPVGMPPISRNTWRYIIYGSGSSRIELKDLKITGGYENCVRSDSWMLVEGCDISNPMGGGVQSFGHQFFVENNYFHDIFSYASRCEQLFDEQINQLIVKNYPYMEVTGNTFKNIGHYGTNTHAVWDNHKAYIARNEFIDVNYSAIGVGKHNFKTDETQSVALIEYNFFHHTLAWIAKRQELGLQDSGDIYIRANNGKTTVRFNRILDCGGKGKNNAIYADDGAYNVEIYGNVISGTENHFDIDSRDVSSWVTSNDPDNQYPWNLPNGTHVCTNNYIAYSICDGYLRMQENTEEDVSQTYCVFLSNFIVPRHSSRTENAIRSIVNKLKDYNNGEAIVTDGTGVVAAATLFALQDGNDGIENVSGD